MVIFTISYLQAPNYSFRFYFRFLEILTLWETKTSAPTKGRKE